jgi:hypothetical protein
LRESRIGTQRATSRSDVGEELALSATAHPPRHAVGYWRRRYAAKGVDGLLKDATRPPGRKRLTARKINDELKHAIMDYLDNHNGHPKPYIWTKTATEIFSKVARAKQVLESQH